jgi:hypothetical protein
VLLVASLLVIARNAPSLQVRRKGMGTLAGFEVEVEGFL